MDALKNEVYHIQRELLDERAKAKALSEDGTLAPRLAALCAVTDERASLVERTDQALALERAIVTGTAPRTDAVDALIEELAGHLRALLRDVLCGHLDADLRAVADGLLAQPPAVAADEPEVAGPAEPAAPAPEPA